MVPMMGYVAAGYKKRSAKYNEPEVTSGCQAVRSTSWDLWKVLKLDRLGVAFTQR
jgi:hypothetical protein